MRRPSTGRESLQEVAQGVHEDHGAGDHDRREGVDDGRDPEADRRVDEEGKRRRTRARHEEGDDEILERHGDRGEEARRDARQGHGQDDPEKSLELRGAQVPRRLDDARIRFLEPGGYEEVDEGDIEGRVGYPDRQHAEPHAYAREEDQEGDSHDYLRHDHRDEAHGLYVGLEPERVASRAHGGESS